MRVPVDMSAPQPPPPPPPPSGGGVGTPLKRSILAKWTLLQEAEEAAAAEVTGVITSTTPTPTPQKKSKSPLPNRGIKRKYENMIFTPDPKILPVRTRSQAKWLNDSVSATTEDRNKGQQGHSTTPVTTTPPNMSKTRQPIRPPSPVRPKHKPGLPKTPGHGQQGGQGRQTSSGRISRPRPPSPPITHSGSRRGSRNHGNRGGVAGRRMPQLSPSSTPPPRLERMDLDWTPPGNKKVKGRGRGRPRKEKKEEKERRPRGRPTKVREPREVTSSTDTVYIGEVAKWRKFMEQKYLLDAPPIPAVSLPRVNVTSGGGGGQGQGQEEEEEPEKVSSTGIGSPRGEEIPVMEPRQFPPATPPQQRMEAELITLDDEDLETGNNSGQRDTTVQGMMGRKDNPDEIELDEDDVTVTNTSSSSGFGDCTTSGTPPSPLPPLLSPQVPIHHLNSGHGSGRPDHVYFYRKMFPSPIDFGKAFRLIQTLNNLLTMEPNSELRVLTKDLVEVHQKILQAQRQAAFKVCDTHHNRG